VAVDDELQVWLDDDLVDRAAPSRWTHVTTAAEAISLLDTGRVVELSLDHDLGDDERFGRGVDVVDWLAEQQEVHDRVLWPRDGITLHTANGVGRDTMARTVERYAQQRLRVRRSVTASGKLRLRFAPHETIAQLVEEAARLAGTEPRPSALYLAAGDDTRPFVFLQSAFLASHSAADVPAPAVFVYVDRKPAEMLPLDWSNTHPSGRETLVDSRPMVTVGVVVLGSDDPASRRRFGLVRLQARDQEVIRWMRDEGWLPDVAVTVRDGCNGFGGQERGRCEAQLRRRDNQLASLVGPQQIRWWVTDHFKGIREPVTSPLRDGDEVRSSDDEFDLVLRLRARLSAEWGWDGGCVQGATLFEAVSR
jgi:hypothetical protein